VELQPEKGMGGSQGKGEPSEGVRKVRGNTALTQTFCSAPSAAAQNCCRTCGAPLASFLLRQRTSCEVPLGKGERGGDNRGQEWG